MSIITTHERYPITKALVQSHQELEKVTVWETLRSSKWRPNTELYDQTEAAVLEAEWDYFRQLRNPAPGDYLAIQVEYPFLPDVISPPTLGALLRNDVKMEDLIMATEAVHRGLTPEGTFKNDRLAEVWRDFNTVYPNYALAVVAPFANYDRKFRARVIADGRSFQLTPPGIAYWFNR